MAERPVKIKVFSNYKDVTVIDNAIRQLAFRNIQANALYPKSFDIKSNDIVILQIKEIESQLLKKIIEKKSELKNKFIFLIRENDATLVSYIAKLGFNDIFTIPFEIYRFNNHLFELISNKTYITDEKEPTIEEKENVFKNIIGNSEQFSRIVELAKRVSENRSISVVILGETGTGKGMLASAIHNYTNPGNLPFVDIVCSSIPENLLESELFGYEKGAFTNALSRKLGLFELAEKGTLFLDEIGDLTLNLQVKLLRVIEKKVIRRLGGVTDLPIDIRIISATNKNLLELVEQNIFRRDLYHRLNVVSLELPPLRERNDDALLIADFYVKAYSKQFNKQVVSIDSDVLQFIKNYTWPGNIRELKNAIERAVLLSDKKSLNIKDFSNIVKNIPVESPEFKDTLIRLPQFIRLDLLFEQTNLKNLEKIYAREVLKKLGNNKSKTAKLLGISRPKLDLLLK
ncbi:MAG: sigma-54-dependent Fis family transcriptional regulator [Ignavibacteriales bacterium]|nr:MAG: sigma-54-dependent Fis family transcriptional regulator [Ignavibacteriales bacterium]